jgi:AraC-like DNA-binding protein
MPAVAAKTAPLIFSTQAIPERERVLRWREEFGRSILHIDIEPLSDAPFHAHATLRAVGGVRTLLFKGSAMRIRRARADLADNDESIGLILNCNAAEFSQLGRNVVLGPGDAIAALHGEPGGSTFVSGSHLSVVLSRDSLASRVKDIESTAMRLIPRHSEALRLLVRYLRLMLAKAGLSTPELRDAVATHVQDLVALSLTASSPLGESNASAVVAARQTAALDHIQSHFQDPELSLVTVADSLGVSPRYVQRLLERSETSFTAHVNELRLQRAFMLLKESTTACRISDIAFEVGFSDVSHFNRLFRSRFGDTPSAVRSQLPRNTQARDRT